MNDRFKFRVWNVLKQKFEPETRTHILGNGELVLIDECGKTYVKDNPNYKVSFCIGVKDRNNKLIYDGDIIRYYFPCDDKICHQDYVVKYKNKGLYLVFETLDGLDEQDFDDYIFEGEEYKVIGNIYENPDVLEENENEQS